MDLSKDLLESSLPIQRDELTIRRMNRSDMDLLLRWPAYPWPYDVFRFSFQRLSRDEMDRVHEQRARSEDRIALVVDGREEQAIGYIALVQIDWAARRAENMAFRVHPDFCNRGLGARILILIRDWWFGQGMNALRLDVAATNSRAVRCYQKSGFQMIGEFWRDAPNLIGKDLSEEKYRFLGDHIDCASGAPQVRFYWMEPGARD